MKLCLACSQPFAGAEWRCPACGFTPGQAGGFPSFAAPMAGDGFSPEHFASLAGLEARHFWFQARNRLIVGALRRYFPAMRDFLEVGCGTGYVLSAVTQAFPQASISGSEYFAEGLSFAAARVPGAVLCQADARRLPFAEEFDVIGAFDVLEHVAEDEQALCSIRRALRPSGGLVVTVPQHRWLWSRTDEAACHVRRYTRNELAMKITAVGFEVIAVTSFVSLLLPVLLAVRRRSRRSDAVFDPLAELRINPWLNRTLAGVMAVERVFLACGLRFPAGGSLLMVARKTGGVI